MALTLQAAAHVPPQQRMNVLMRRTRRSRQRHDHGDELGLDGHRWQGSRLGASYRLCLCSSLVSRLDLTGCGSELKSEVAVLRAQVRIVCLRTSRAFVGRRLTSHACSQRLLEGCDGSCLLDARLLLFACKAMRTDEGSEFGGTQLGRGRTRRRSA
eukprot:scaffold5429_cov32-Tisochrysis_lutea.AAC.5